MNNALYRAPPCTTLTILRVGAHILVDTALGHARAALGGGHGLVGVQLVEFIEIVGTLVAEALHIEVHARLVLPVVVLGHGTGRVPELRDFPERLGGRIVVAADLLQRRDEEQELICKTAGCRRDNSCVALSRCRRTII